MDRSWGRSSQSFDWLMSTWQREARSLIKTTLSHLKALKRRHSLQHKGVAFQEHLVTQFDTSKVGKAYRINRYDNKPIRESTGASLKHMLPISMDRRRGRFLISSEQHLPKAILPRVTVWSCGRSVWYFNVMNTDPMSILFTRLYPFNCNLDGVSQLYDFSLVDRTPFSLISPNKRGKVLHIWI